MTYFADKTGYILSVSMTDRNANIDFEDEFFEVGGLKVNDNGYYIVNDIVYLTEQAKDCWACIGDFSDGGGANAFDLNYCICDNSGIIYKVFNSEDIAEMAEKYDVPYSAVI